MTPQSRCAGPGNGNPCRKGIWLIAGRQDRCEPCTRRRARLGLSLAPTTTQQENPQ